MVVSISHPTACENSVIEEVRIVVRNLFSFVVKRLAR
jgi:hypothetical protein